MVVIFASNAYTTVTRPCEPCTIGLLGMSERARLLGGRVRIAGVQGRGTTVTVQIPIS